MAKRKSSSTTKNTQKKTNKVFKQNVDTFNMVGRRLGVLAVFNTQDTIVPFRVVVPYDGVVVKPNDTEDEIKSNIGMIFYGFNYYEEIKHLQNIEHSGFTEALSFAVAALAKFAYQSQEQVFGSDDLGVIMSFNFNKLPNHDYEISSAEDSVCLGFNEWIETSDRIKLHLADNHQKGGKLVENQVLVF